MDVSDYDKRTALHVAASEGYYDIVKFLINVAKVRVNPLDRLSVNWISESHQ